MSQVVLYPGWTVYDANGNPAAGAKARFFTAGTSTPVDVYSDSTLTTPHAVPVVADAHGLFPIIYAASGDYKIKVTNSADVDLWPEVDDWTVISASVASATISFPPLTKTANYTVQDVDRGKVIEADASAGNIIITMDSSTLGAGFPIWVLNSGATGTVTTQFGGGQTVNGLSSFTLPTRYTLVGLVSRGAAGWTVFSSQGVIISPLIMQSKSIEEAKGASIASATTCDIWTPKDGNLIHITGNTGPIGSFGTALQAGATRTIIFDSNPTITNSASIVCPTGANIVVTAGDRAVIRADSTTIANIISYTRADGTALAGAFVVATYTASQTDQEAASSTTLFVTPGRQQFHPSAAKVWGKTTGTTTPTLGVSYNMTSITDSGVGLLTITIATDFSSGDWAVLASHLTNAASTSFNLNIQSQAAGSAVLALYSTLNNGAATAIDPQNASAGYHWIGFGDQ